MNVSCDTRGGLLLEEGLIIGLCALWFQAASQALLLT